MMALITRLARLLRADLHAVLDRIEEPDVLLSQSIREMDDALAEDQQRAVVLRREINLNGARATELEHKASALDGELDVCFDANKDDLAREVIRRQLEAGRAHEALQTRRAALARELELLEPTIIENRRRLDEMRQAANLRDENKVAVEPVDDWRPGESVVSAADVEVAWLREQRKRRTS